MSQAQFTEIDVPVAATQAPAKKAKQIQMQAPSTGGFSFARKQDSSAAQNKAIGAKKLDLDFGNGDDFFNSFQPAEAKPESTNQL